MVAALIEMDCVSREFDGGRVQALREVNLRLEPGEWLTIVGPSGSGKSTLLNLMCGLDLPSGGEVRFEGRSSPSAAAWTRIRSRRLGFIFQSYNLLPTLTSLENVQIPMFGVYGRRERLIPSCSLLTTYDMLFSGRRRACGNPKNCRKALLRVWQLG